MADPKTEAADDDAAAEVETPDFDKMSKKELDAWATAHGVPLDRRKNKPDMLAELKAAMANQAPGDAEEESKDPDQAGEPEGSKPTVEAVQPVDAGAKPNVGKKSKTVTVLVREHAQSRGVDLRVNGHAKRIPLNTPTEIPTDWLDALDRSDVHYEIVKG